LDAPEVGVMLVVLIGPNLPTLFEQPQLVVVELHTPWEIGLGNLFGLWLWRNLGPWLNLGRTAAPVKSTVVLVVLLGLAVVGPGTVVTIVIIEMQSVRTGWIAVQVQEAISGVITIGFAKTRAAKPPSGAI